MCCCLEQPSDWHEASRADHEPDEDADQAHTRNEQAAEEGPDKDDKRAADGAAEVAVDCQISASVGRSQHMRRYMQEDIEVDWIEEILADSCFCFILYSLYFVCISIIFLKLYNKNYVSFCE